MAKIRDNAQRAAIVVRNLLTFARPSKPQRKPIQLNDEVRHVVDLRSYELHVSNIEVTLSLKRDLPRTFADPRQLQQVFLNILVNCEQAILSAKQGGRIAISTAEVDGFVRASFSDDGPGIKPENFKRLFQPFFTTKEPGKGTGLGLSISQSILAEHGGRIRAESEPGRGATFIVELPIMHEAPVHTAGAVHERNQS
ncbi:MAG: hypothetical protein HY261_10860 [Chloroflexi bacterium]|nr:hypothetical protein [Chloroflexota bacterium]